MESVASRAVRKVKEGTACVLSQSGWNTEWWDWALLCFCFLRNVQDPVVEGQTAWRKRFGSDFPGPKIPFGAQVTYSVEKVTPPSKGCIHGVFLGYQQQAGGAVRPRSILSSLMSVRDWLGDLLYFRLTLPASVSRSLIVHSFHDPPARSSSSTKPCCACSRGSFGSIGQSALILCASLAQP